jgi:hypothetical protein
MWLKTFSKEIGRQYGSYSHKDDPFEIKKDIFPKYCFSTKIHPYRLKHDNDKKFPKKSNNWIYSQHSKSIGIQAHQNTHRQGIIKKYRVDLHISMI